MIILLLESTSSLPLNSLHPYHEENQKMTSVVPTQQKIHATFHALNFAQSSLHFWVVPRMVCCCLGTISIEVGRRQWHPTPVLLPGKSHGQRSLVGCSLWVAKSRHDWATSLSFFTFMHWGRKWQPTPVFLPGESQGRESLVGWCLWGRTESDTTEAT